MRLSEREPLAIASGSGFPVKGMPESVVRAWCLALSRTLPVQRINPNGVAYLERYFVAGWNPINKRPGPSIFLHRFVASDPDTAVHSHPWGWSSSLILVGGYREERCDGRGGVVVREFRPGDVNILDAHIKHRIDLVGKDCWTLFLAGPFEKAWSFSDSCGVY